MSDLRDIQNAARRRMPSVSFGALAFLAAAVTLLVNFGAVYLERGLLGLENSTLEALWAAMDDARVSALVGAAGALRLLKGLQAPLYVFLLTEAFHSGHRRHLAALALTAAVSEPLYDWAMTGAAWDLSRQSPALGMAICLVMLFGMGLTERLAQVERGLCRGLIALGALLWVVLLRVDTGGELVLLTAVFCCLRRRFVLRLALGVLISAVDPLGPLAFLPICCCAGPRRPDPPGAPVYLLCALYPAQLLLLALLAA